VPLLIGNIETPSSVGYGLHEPETIDFHLPSLISGRPEFALIVPLSSSFRAIFICRKRNLIP
jgi:hypothetical protein